MGPVLTSLVTSLVPVFWSVLVITLGFATDADDPPKETEGCGLRLGMKDDTGPLQYASHSWILGRVSFNCIGQCTIDSFRQPQPVVRTQTGRLSTGSQFYSDMLR